MNGLAGGDIQVVQPLTCDQGIAGIEIDILQARRGTRRPERACRVNPPVGAEKMDGPTNGCWHQGWKGHIDTDQTFDRNVVSRKCMSGSDSSPTTARMANQDDRPIPPAGLLMTKNLANDPAIRDTAEVFGPDGFHTKTIAQPGKTVTENRAIATKEKGKGRRISVRWIGNTGREPTESAGKHGARGAGSVQSSGIIGIAEREMPGCASSSARSMAISIW